MYRNIGSASLLLLALAPADAFAADVVWNSTKTFASFDCRPSADRIVISGVVNLVHPDDADLRKPAKYITIICPNLKFEPSAKLTSDSSLDIRIEKVVAGPVFVESTRGKKGADAPPTPDRWQQSVAASGSGGGNGGNGDDGEECWKFGHGSSAGGDGQRGGRGTDGKNGDTGADGLTGMNGSTIRLIAGAFDRDVTIETNSVGGDGGRGGLGGRGQDGGSGATGGNGGEGGDSRGCHDASRGGSGGGGGDGGNGGNGGPGGQGGNGGHGGNITVGLKVGSEPPGVPKYNVDGGSGGFGGTGGQYGVGGAGGTGGHGGRGGRGANILIITKPDGSNGWEGANGVAGRDGKPGPNGLSGRDGDAGTFGGTKWGTLSEDDFNKNF
jgi:hypothetical protein